MGNHNTSGLKKKLYGSRLKNNPGVSGSSDTVEPLSHSQEVKETGTGNGILKHRKSHQQLLPNQSAAHSLVENILSSEQKELIKLSWPFLEKNFHDILLESFIKLFADNPMLKEKFFQFRNLSIEDLRKKNDGSKGPLHHHVPRVSRAIGKVVASIDHLEKVIEYLQVLGKIHSQNGIKINEISLLAPYVITFSSEYLPDHLQTARVIGAWTSFYGAVDTLMRRGYPEVELSLSASEVSVLWDSLQMIKEELVDATKGTLELQRPEEMYRLCPTRLVDKREMAVFEEALQTHGPLLLKTAEAVLHETNMDPGKSDDYLRMLGRIHEKSNIRVETLDLIGPMFCFTMAERMHWDGEVKATWMHLFRLISSRMKQGYKDRLSLPVHRNRSASACTTPIIRLSPSPSDESSSGRLGHIYQKRFQQGQVRHRRVSVDDGVERKIRLHSNHSQHQQVHHGHHRSNAVKVKGSSPQVSPSKRLSASELESSKRWSSYGSGLAIGSSSAALIMQASAAAHEAEAEAKARRRSSLHQLLHWGFHKDLPCSRMRPRSRSAPFAEDIVLQKESEN